MLNCVYMSSRDGYDINVASHNIVSVVMLDNPSGAMYLLEVPDGLRGCELDLEVDKYMKNITCGIENADCYRFVKKAQNVYFYR